MSLIDTTNITAPRVWHVYAPFGEGVMTLIHARNFGGYDERPLRNSCCCVGRGSSSSPLPVCYRLGSEGTESRKSSTTSCRSVVRPIIPPSCGGDTGSNPVGRANGVYA